MKFKNMIERICYNTSENDDIKEMLDSMIQTIDYSGENILFHTKVPSEVICLVEKGADVNVINSNGENVLFQHVREKNNEVIKYFIQKGTKYDLENNVGDNLLSISCRFLNYDMVDFFTHNGLTLDPEQSKSVFYKIAENTTRFNSIFSKIINHLDFSFYKESYKQYDNILLFLLSEKNTIYSLKDNMSIFQEDFIISMIKDNLNKIYTHNNNIFLLSARYLNFSDFIHIYDLYDFKDYTNDSGENILFVATTFGNIDILNHLINQKELIIDIDKHQKNIQGHNIIEHMKLKGFQDRHPEMFSKYHEIFGFCS